MKSFSADFRPPSPFVATEHPPEFCSKCDVAEAIGRKTDGADQNVQEVHRVAGIGVEFQTIQEVLTVYVLPRGDNQRQTIQD